LLPCQNKNAWSQQVKPSCSEKQKHVVGCELSGQQQQRNYINQGCQVGFFEKNFTNLAFFQVGWLENFIWLFWRFPGIVSSWLVVESSNGLLAFYTTAFSSAQKNIYYSNFIDDTFAKCF